MLLGLHTYSFYLHGIGQAWADFKLPWPRQMSTFELFDEAVRLGLDGLHLDDGVLENLDGSYLEDIKAAAAQHQQQSHRVGACPRKHREQHAARPAGETWRSVNASH